MDHKPHPSLKPRQRKVLGKFQFQTPVTPQSCQGTAAPTAPAPAPATTGNQPPPQPPRANKRREQILRAQRDHRKRTQEYISALEAEVLRLRAEETRLHNVSDAWMRCAVTLLESTKRPAHTQSYNANAQSPRGLFLWAVRDTADHEIDINTDIGIGIDIDDAGRLDQRVRQLKLWQAQQLLEFQRPTILPYLDTHTASVHELLQNFCDNIAPTLNTTEASTSGYLNRIMPLAMGNATAQNAFLAASGRHLQTLWGSFQDAETLRYRSAAIRGLQAASTEGSMSRDTSITTLTTILGLLIDDAIGDIKDYPMLLRLVETWARMGGSEDYKSSNLSIKFLLEQIQMIKTLIHPLYRFNEAYRTSRNPQPTKQNRNATPHHNQPDLRSSLMNVQSAVAQACHIYNEFPAADSLKRSWDFSSPATLDSLLDQLQSVVITIPPFTPGENSLTWVYSTAVSRSVQPQHKTFFTLRLAELMSRTGFSDLDITEYIEGAGS